MVTTAKTSVPIILYTTEQIFCAHFMVKLFRWWLRRVEGGEERCCEEGEERVDVEENGISTGPRNVGEKECEQTPR